MSTDVINSCSAGYSESVRIAVSLNSEVFILRQLIRSISESVGIPIHELAGLLREFPNEDGTFRRYLDVKSGLVGGKIVGIGSVDGDGTDLSRGCLADNLAELEVVPNPDQREVDEWSEEESGDEEDLEDEDFVRFLQCGV